MPPHKEYRREWVNAGYDERMGSAWVTLPPPPDRIRLYHFTSADFALSNIALSRLKVARFSDVNDPFELLALNFRVRGVRSKVRRFKTSHNDLTGLLCFSANWTSVVLWSHYASKHRGICLGFDLQRDSVQRVRYEDQRILAELDESENDPTKISPELQETLLCTKFRQWDYEQEYRKFVKLSEMTKDGSLYFCPFDGHMKLVEVILGPHCYSSLASVRKLIRAHHHDAVAIEARLAFGSFSVAPNELTIP